MKLNLFFVINAFLGMVYTIPGYAQKDTVWVKTTYSQEIVNGKHTINSSVINQKTYYLSGLLFREIDYNLFTKQLETYTNYFYTSDTLIRKEVFLNSDSLVYLEQYGYRNNLLIDIKRMEISNNKLELVHIKKLNYNGSLLVSEKWFNPKHKIYKQVDYTYENDLLVQKETHNKSRQDTIKSSLIKYYYNDSVSSPEKVLYYYKLRKKPDLSYTSQITFDPEKRKSSKAIYDEKEKLIEQTNYQYDNYNRIQIKTSYDSQGREISLLSYLYEQKIINIGILNTVIN